MVFLFQFVYMVNYIDGFSYFEPSLHPWDEAYLILLDNFSDVFLDSVIHHRLHGTALHQRLHRALLYQKLHGTVVHQRKHGTASLSLI